MDEDGWGGGDVVGAGSGGSTRKEEGFGRTEEKQSVGIV